MVKPIVKDALFLGRKAEKMVPLDAYMITDMKDTLSFHRDHCVGMAGNMIGYNKSLIIVSTGLGDLIMVNPLLKSKKGPYVTMEGCLSLIGERKATRYREIVVEYQDEHFQKKTGKYSGYIAQIIQHEMDHLNGILI